MNIKEFVKNVIKRSLKVWAFSAIYFTINILILNLSYKEAISFLFEMLIFVFFIILFFSIIVEIVECAWANKVLKSQTYSEEYYRDIIKNYSPAELSYLHDHKVELKKDVYATILMLKLKNKISIENKKINILKWGYGLSATEKLVFDSLINKEPISKIERKYIDALGEDLKSKELIDKKFDSDKIMFICIIAAMITVQLIILHFMFVVLALILLIIGLYFKGIGETGAVYRFSKKGKEIGKSIYGMKLYLKDYSMMQERSIEEIALWDEYYIYSVFLNENKKAIKEIEKILSDYEVNIQW